MSDITARMREYPVRKEEINAHAVWVSKLGRDAPTVRCHIAEKETQVPVIGDPKTDLSSRGGARCHA